MKKLLPALILSVFALAGCKKENASEVTPAVSTSALELTSYTSYAINGDVTLRSQADVNAFIKAHKGQQVKIKGNLSIGTANDPNDISSLAGLTNTITTVSGAISIGNIQIADAQFLNAVTSAGSLSVRYCNFALLSLKSLQSFSGDIELYALPKLTRLSISKLTIAKNITISICPLLADLSSLNAIRSAQSIRLSFLGATTISMDNLTSVSATGIYLNFLKVTSVSFKSLTTINGPVYIYACNNLSKLNFKALRSVSDRLTIFAAKITDLSGFEAVQTLGALNLTNNALLTSLQGLEHLTTLKMPGINGVVKTGVIMGAGGLTASLGGITIQSNEKLATLAGLQNVKTVPVAYISGNNVLDDLCPFKGPILKLKAAKPFTYTTYNAPDGQYHYNQTVAALTLQGNGKYKTTQDGLKALALCKPTPPKLGTISGTVIPGAWAIKSIIANTPGGPSSGYSIADPGFDSFDSFKFVNIPVGVYTVTFNVTPGYLPQKLENVVVADGQNTDLAVIFLKSSRIPGSLSGTVSPAGSAVGVRADPIQDDGSIPILHTIPDPVTGKFKFDNVVPWQYMITFEEKANFTAPGVFHYFVDAKKNTDMGVLLFTSFGTASVFSCKFNGADFSTGGTASYNAPIFTLNGDRRDGDWESVGYTRHYLNLTLDNITGPGTYLLNSKTSSVLSYEVIHKYGDDTYWSSDNPGGNAKVVVSTFNKATGTVSGTFSGTLTTANGGKLVVTNGKFTTTYK